MILHTTVALNAIVAFVLPSAALLSQRTCGIKNFYFKDTGHWNASEFQQNTSAHLAMAGPILRCPLGLWFDKNVHIPLFFCPYILSIKLNIFSSERVSMLRFWYGRMHPANQGRNSITADTFFLLSDRFIVQFSLAQVSTDNDITLWNFSCVLFEAFLSHYS